MAFDEYIAGGSLDADLKHMLDGQTLKATSATAPPDAFMASLPKPAAEALRALTARLSAGTFPELRDFDPAWGADTSVWPNVDPDAFCLANDGAGNYWLLCADGSVQSWCHDEGGIMEDHTVFQSLDEAIACFVRATAVMEEEVSLDEVRDDFEEASSESSPGWEWMLENLEELVEDL